MFMHKPRRLLPLFVLFFIAWPAAPIRAQQISYHRVEQATVEERFKGSPSDNLGRQKKLHQLFESAGCTGATLTEAEVEGSTLPNVVCKLAGESDSVIVVGAHYDKVTAGMGVVDNWSGAALLASLFESLGDGPRRHTFLFIGFTDEEKGLVGSGQFLEQTTAEQRSRIRAMINLDSLGLSPTKVWLSRADKGLAAALNNVAHSMKLPLAAVNVEQVGTSDSEPFAQRKIPSLTIHSVTQETFPVLHSEQDRLSAIRMDDYYATYRLVAAYLSYLDQKAGGGRERRSSRPKNRAHIPTLAPHPKVCWLTAQDSHVVHSPHAGRATIRVAIDDHYRRLGSAYRKCGGLLGFVQVEDGRPTNQDDRLREHGDCHSGGWGGQKAPYLDQCHKRRYRENYTDELGGGLLLVTMESMDTQAFKDLGGSGNRPPL